MDRRVGFLAIIVVALELSTGCGTAHTARPLGKGHTAVNVGLGGPIADVGGATIPVPMPTIGIKHGISDRHDLYASWHVLPAVLGVAAFDVGASWYLMDQRGGRPGLSAAGTLIATFDAQDAWAAVDTQLTASWKLHPRHLLYVGFHVLFAPARTEVVEGPAVHLAPLLGGEVRLGRRQRFGLGLELKWADPWKDTEMMVVDYAGSRGALCVTGGFNVYLGDGSERRARRQGGGEP